MCEPLKAIISVIVVSQSRWGTLISRLFMYLRAVEGDFTGRWSFPEPLRHAHWTVVYSRRAVGDAHWPFIFMCFTAIAAILLVGVRKVQKKCFQRAVEARSLAVAVLQGRRDTLVDLLVVARSVCSRAAGARSRWSLLLVVFPTHVCL